jgi:hypothetical protein
MPYERRTAGKSPGIGVDAFGGRTVDPTRNVIALVKAESAAAKALRKADIKYNDSQHAHLREIGKLRSAYAETMRVSDLDRWDKTRKVDVEAGTASAAALATAVQTLANTSDRNAETLRNLVTATAQTMAKQTADQALVLSAQTDSLVKDINMRIAELQKASYQGVGKSSVADPMMAEWMTEMRGIVKNQATTGGQRQGVNAMWLIIVGAVGLVGTLTMMAVAGVTLVVFLASRAGTTPPTAPQVIYTPAPPGTQLPSTPPTTVPR